MVSANSSTLHIQLYLANFLLFYYTDVSRFPYSSVTGSTLTESLCNSGLFLLKNGLVAVSFLVRPWWCKAGSATAQVVLLLGENMSSKTASVKSSMGPKGSSIVWL